MPPLLQSETDPVLRSYAVNVDHVHSNEDKKILTINSSLALECHNSSKLQHLSVQ